MPEEETRPKSTKKANTSLSSGSGTRMVVKCEV